MDKRGFGIPLHHNNTGRYNSSTVARIQALVTQHGWRIHPRFTEALMGLPIGWSGTESLETGVFQSWLRSHSKLLQVGLA